jgi:hypothetical protein
VTRSFFGDPPAGLVWPLTAEAGVRFAQSYILGRLRRQTFFSLAEANHAITGVLERMNAHVMRRLGISRRQLFETLERFALAPLPDTDHEFAEWRFARVAATSQPASTT